MKRFKQRFTGHQISVSMIMWLIAFAALTCGAGITYAVLKNDQIQVARDIKQMNEEIASCELTKEYYPFQDFLPDQPLGHPRQAGPGQVQPAAYRALSRRIHFFRKRLPHRCGRPLTALSRS